MTRRGLFGFLGKSVFAGAAVAIASKLPALTRPVMGNPITASYAQTWCVWYTTSDPDMPERSGMLLDGSERFMPWTGNREDAEFNAKCGNAIWDDTHYEARLYPS
jgi:hypothetical protein